MLLVTIAYHVNQFQQHLSIFIEVCQQITLYKFKLQKYGDLKYVYIVKMVTNVGLVNTHITSHSQNLGGSVMVRNLKMYSLSNFQTYNSILLTIITSLYSTSPGLSHLITGSLYSLFIFTYFPLPSTPRERETVYLNLFQHFQTNKISYNTFTMLTKTLPFTLFRIIVSVFVKSQFYLFCKSYHIKMKMIPRQKNRIYTVTSLGLKEVDNTVH